MKGHKHYVDCWRSSYQGGALPLTVLLLQEIVSIVRIP